MRKICDRCGRLMYVFRNRLFPEIKFYRCNGCGALAHNCNVIL